MKTYFFIFTFLFSIGWAWGQTANNDTVQSIVDNTGRIAENDTTKRLKAVIYSQLPHTYPHTFNYPHLLKDFRKEQ